jgi:release factor glutamine methyltransferase
VTDAPLVRRALVASGLVPLDAQVLLAHVLGVSRAWLAAHGTDALPPDAAIAFFALAQRRRDGEPVAYLTGVREFWGLALRVTPDVLIPRPETETLVELALTFVTDARPSRMLDLGTGSGAIAIALAHERPQAQVTGVDISAAAIAVARDNAARLNLANVKFVQSDWYAALAGARYDLIAANPPYVAGSDPHLQEGDLRFEPVVALSPGEDGGSALRTVVDGARPRLAPGGWLVVEHGFDQSNAVQDLFRAAGFEGIVALRDLAGIPRIVAGAKDGTL